MIHLHLLVGVRKTVDLSHGVGNSVLTSHSLDFLCKIKPRIEEILLQCAPCIRALEQNKLFGLLQ